MATRSFNPIAQSVRITYQCPHCQNKNTTDELSVPVPNWEAESSLDSLESESYDVVCDNCGRELEFLIHNSFCEGMVEAENLDESDLLGVEEILLEEDGLYDKELFDITHDEVSELLEAVDGMAGLVKDKFYKMLYANVITSMETYLSDTMKQYVLGYEEYLRKFVESYKPYDEIKVNLSKIFKEREKLKEEVKETLNELMYHNLGKLKPIYKAIFNVDFGDINELCKAVQIRHDLVHRNGKNKDGILRTITKEDVKELSTTVNEFIFKIDGQMPLLPGTGVTEKF